MKARVIQEFKDKYSGKIHSVGDTITISKERFAEILKVGELVEDVAAPKKQIFVRENEENERQNSIGNKV
jgi:hypothetical protein